MNCTPFKFGQFWFCSLIFESFDLPNICFLLSCHLTSKGERFFDGMAKIPMNPNEEGADQNFQTLKNKIKIAQI